MSRRQAVRHGILAPIFRQFESDRLIHRKIEGGVRRVNVVFWLLVIIALVLIWFLMAFSYRGIGKFFRKIFNDAEEEINKKDE